MSIVYLGIFRYKELYYDLATETFRTYTTDVLSGDRTEVENKKRLMDFALEGIPAIAPLAAILMYIKVRQMPAAGWIMNVSAVWYVVLSAVIGICPAMIISRVSRRIFENHFQTAVPITKEEEMEARRTLIRDNRLYTVFFIILLLGMIGVPAFYSGSESILSLLGYSAFWFMLCIMLVVIRIWDRWRAEWQIRRNNR